MILDQKLEGWVLVPLGGAWLVGRVGVPDTGHLSPFYEIQATVTPLPPPQETKSRVEWKCAPPLLMDSIDRIVLDGRRERILCSGLDVTDRQRIHSALMDCQDLVRRMRTAKTGIITDLPRGH
jgi:hypothetical protein